MAQTDWSFRTVYWPVCDKNGLLLWGPTMSRVIDGKREYREMTNDEQNCYCAGEAL